MMFARTAGRIALTMLSSQSSFVFVCFTGFGKTSVGAAHEDSSPVQLDKTGLGTGRRGHPYHLRFEDFIAERRRRAIASEAFGAQLVALCFIFVALRHEEFSSRDGHVDTGNLFMKFVTSFVRQLNDGEIFFQLS